MQRNYCSSLISVKRGGTVILNGMVHLWLIHCAWANCREFVELSFFISKSLLSIHSIRLNQCWSILIHFNLSWQFARVYGRSKCQDLRQMLEFWSWLAWVQTCLVTNYHVPIYSSWPSFQFEVIFVYINLNQSVSKPIMANRGQGYCQWYR